MHCTRFTFVLGVLLILASSSWGQVANPENGHQYLLVGGGYTWYQANDSAQKLGGYLVSITSASEQSFVESLIYPEGVFWIGATDSLNEGDWVWTSGESWGYTNWHSGEPSNSSGIENFATVMTRLGYTGQWNDYGALGSAAFIVEWGSPVTPNAVNINFGPDALGDNVFTQTPTIFWTYYDDPASTQVEFEIQVGTDQDWTSAEMWTPGPVTSSDTSVVYAGATLEMPGTYYLRLRVNNGTAWGDWRYATMHVVESARVLIVPDDYATISEAFAAANAFDSVMLRPGVYSGPGFIGLSLPNRPITLYSESGPAVTVLDAAGDRNYFLKADNGADSLTVIRGISFINADSTAVILYNSAPIIANCVFNGNQTDGKGTAISLYYSNLPIIRNCTFESNISSWCGGALSFDRSETPKVQDCRFVANQAPYGGAAISVYSDVTFTRCLFQYNSASGDGAASYNQNSGIHRFDNCTFYANGGTSASSSVIRALENVYISNSIITATTLGRAINASGGPVSLSCTDIYGNANGDWTSDIEAQQHIDGNFSLDPLICDQSLASIPETSPCAPANNSCGVLIGAGTVGCPSVLVNAVSIDGVAMNSHVITESPLFEWSSSAAAQTEFEIAIGTDNSWGIAEMWAPPVFVSASQSVTYAGLSLSDGTKYYGRLRVSDGTEWSAWYSFNFRTNAAPSTPVRVSPGLGVWTTLTPVLTVSGVVDDSGETISYDFQVFTDSLSSSPAAQVSGLPGGTGTFWTVSPGLSDNTAYYWRARAYDGFEYSPWGAFAWFGTNTAPEAPQMFGLISPPVQAGKPVYTLLPEFDWQAAVDPDPFDSVSYTLELATDPGFLFKIQVESLKAITWTTADSLSPNLHYWWRVTARDKTNRLVVATPRNFWTWASGDCDGNQNVDIGDISAMVDALFMSAVMPELHLMYDVNGDCIVDIEDLTVLVRHLFISFEPLKPGCQ